MIWILTGAVVAGFVAASLLAWASRRVPDDIIDALIEGNRAQLVPGMERSDPSIMRKLADRRWAEVTSERRDSHSELLGVLRGER